MYGTLHEFASREWSSQMREWTI